MLAKDPALGGKEIAAQAGPQPQPAGARVQGGDGDVAGRIPQPPAAGSLPVLVDRGGTNLLEAALTAGFGSYAQFHRVFRALRKMTPSEYLQSRG